MFSTGLAMFESPIQIAVVLVIALLVFGPRRMPEIGRQLGSGIRELRKGLSGLSPDEEEDLAPAGRNDARSRPQSFTDPDSRQALPSAHAPIDFTDCTIARRSRTSDQ